MTPSVIARLRVAVPVHHDGPGTLTSHLVRLERAWRERAANDTPPRSCAFSPDELDTDDLSACAMCGKHWAACACEAAE